MNPDKTREAIKVMEAYAEGKQIQARSRTKGEWYNINGGAGETPSWDWDKADYRVQPPIIAPTAPGEYWIILSKSALKPIGVPYLLLKDAEKWVGGYHEHYEIVHVKPVVEKVRPEKWHVGDRVVLARLSSEGEYDLDDGPGWDDSFPEKVGKVGTVKRNQQTEGYVQVWLDGEGTHWYFYAKDLDPA